MDIGSNNDTRWRRNLGEEGVQGGIEMKGIVSLLCLALRFQFCSIVTFELLVEMGGVLFRCRAFNG